MGLVKDYNKWVLYNDHGFGRLKDLFPYSNIVQLIFHLALSVLF